MATWLILIGLLLGTAVTYYVRNLHHTSQPAHGTVPTASPASEPTNATEKTTSKALPGQPTSNDTVQESQTLPPNLPESVTSWDHDTIGRGQWCERIRDYIFTDRHHGRYNVLGINTALEYYAKLEGVVEEFAVVYKSAKGRVVDYRFVVFEKGELLNLGDGSNINWVWSGNYTRLGIDIVSFLDIT